MTGVGCALALLAPVAAIAAEGDQLLATVDKPAIVTATLAKVLESTAVKQVASRVIIYVTGFQPPQKGGVQGVVSVQKPDGSEQQIGTFGIYPQEAFTAGSSREQKFGFPLPSDLAAGPVKLKVAIGPDKERETAAGAQLEVGRAEIQ
jgi:hypothetical protein